MSMALRLWARRLGFLLVALGLANIAWALHQEPATPVRDEGAFWVQVINAGVLLGVGGFVILMFFRFRDQATERSADLDRKLDRINFALLGIDGAGGLVEEVKVQVRRRHDLANQMIRMSERLQDITELLANICHRLNIPFDSRLRDELMSERRDRNEG